MNAYHDAVLHARRLVRCKRNALLSTLSVEMDGWPFGSVIPYVLDYAAQPLLLMSDLAQHSHNVRKDARASLLVWEDDQDDIQQAGRVTLLGRARLLETDDVVRARYRRYVPQADRYFEIHDFRFYHLEVERIRYIGGFGDIHWIRGEDYCFGGDATALWQAEEDAVRHMNDDHRDALSAYCRAVGIEDPAPRLLGVDPEGFDVEATGGRLRFDFEAPVLDPQDLRAAFIRRSRALAGEGGREQGARG